MAYNVTIDTSAILDGANADAADVTTPFANVETAIEDLGNGVSGPETFRLVQIATPSSPASGSDSLYFKSDDILYRKTAGGVETAIGPTAGGTYAQPLPGRLSLGLGAGFTVYDTNAANTLYYQPYNGNIVTLYNGTSWDTYALSAISITLVGLPASTNYDVFIYYSAGLTLELVAWSSDTARATAIVFQNGVYVKSGTTSKRYVGTIRTNATGGQTDDYLLNRLVWNYYNRVPRYVKIADTTDSWTYATATWRPWNNATTNRIGMVRGVDEDPANMTFFGAASSSAGLAQLAIGLDSTIAPTGIYGRAQSTTMTNLQAMYSGLPGIGYHYLQLLEFATAATTTFYGDNAGVQQAGAFGQVMA